MVRRLSPRMPEPFCARRSTSRAPCTRSRSAAHRRARRMASASTRLCCCEREVSQRTCKPVGRCVSSTVDSVLLRFWPPEPVPRHIDQSRSRSSTRTSTAVGSGRTATVMVLVCTRPWRSLGGTRCQRWPPGSSRKQPAAPAPTTRKSMTPRRSSRSSISKTVAERAARVDGELLLHEQLGVVAAFGGADLDDDGHGSPPAGEGTGTRRRIFCEGRSAERGEVERGLHDGFRIVSARRARKSRWLQGARAILIRQLFSLQLRKALQ